LFADLIGSLIAASEPQCFPQRRLPRLGRWIMMKRAQQLLRGRRVGRCAGKSEVEILLMQPLTGNQGRARALARGRRSAAGGAN
jgi:hypothetical protein